MKSFIILLIIAIFSFFAISEVFPQASGKNNDNPKDEHEIDVESFMGMFDGLISDDLIDEMSYNLPENLVVVNYGVGDFSGDGTMDIAVSMRDETCHGKCYKVMLMVNDDNKTYRTVGELYADWKDTPYDVAFEIKDGLCLITYREGEKWKSMYYNFSNTADLRKVNSELAE
jgi:hypothetical protein